MENENIMTEVNAPVDEQELETIEREFDKIEDSQTLERHKRAAYAARRRNMERQQAIEKAVLKEREANKAEIEKYKGMAAKAAEDEVLREIAKIREDDPDIGSVADLLSLPNAEEFKRNVRRGLSLSEAYYLTNRQALMGKARSAAGKQAANKVMSKSHLTATRSRSAGAKAVPGDLMAMYKTLNPTATAAQIERHYNEYLNN